MKKQTFLVRQNPFARDIWRKAFEFGAELLQLGPVEIVVRSVRETRSLEQNEKMWAMLKDISQQVEWPIDGRLQYLEDEEWKDIFTAGLKKHQRIAAGLEGGFVILGQRTSKMTVGQMGDLIELMTAFGAQRGVQWSDPKAKAQMAYYAQNDARQAA